MLRKFMSKMWSSLKGKLGSQLYLIFEKDASVKVKHDGWIKRRLKTKSSTLSETWKLIWWHKVRIVKLKRCNSAKLGKNRLVEFKTITFNKRGLKKWDGKW